MLLSGARHFWLGLLPLQVYDWVEFFSGEGKVSAEMKKACLVSQFFLLVLHYHQNSQCQTEAGYCGVELDRILEGAPRAFDFLTEGGFAFWP